MLQRLQHAGAEERLTKGKFRFRRKCGTTEAIFAARRQIELAWAGRTSQVSLLALDWAKAFESIDPHALVVMLSRFGLPDVVLNIVRNIYIYIYIQTGDFEPGVMEVYLRSGISGQGSRRAAPCLHSCS